MNPDVIKSSLKKNRILNSAILFDTIDSTNKHLMENNYSNGTIAAAAEQSAGRGKHGAKWVSSKGGLWFSFVINKKISKPYLFVILTSVAVMDVLKMYKVNSSIKWPNDIIVNSKKICGILIENDTYNKKLVTGVGVNLNNTPPKNSLISAVSLKQINKMNIDVEEFFILLISRLDYYITKLSLLKKRIISKWIANQYDIAGKIIKIGTGSKIKNYEVISVRKNGSIRVKDKKGKLRELKGEIFFL